MKTYPQIYIEHIYATSGGSSCSLCRAPSVKGMCERHLKAMRDWFNSWVKKRYKQGKCYQCHNKRYQKEQRCKQHKEKNRKRCLKWSRTNREKTIEKYWTLRNLGLCVRSAKHGKAYKNHMCCKKCHFHTKELKRKYQK